MELNRELIQRCWLGVKHYVLADSFGMLSAALLLSFLTPTSGAS